MTSRADHADDPSPYAPRWARNAPDKQKGIHTGDRWDEVGVGRDQLRIEGFPVPRSLDPEIVLDPLVTHRSPFDRLLRVLGYLVIAGSAAGMVTLVAVGRLSIPGTISATEQLDNRTSLAARAAPPVSSPRVGPSAAEQSSGSSMQLGIPVVLAPVERLQVPNISTPTPGKGTRGPEVGMQAPAKMTPAVKSVDQQSEEVATLIKRGEQLAATGDMAAARLLLRRAAEAHNARAALALAATYDPNVLQSLGFYGLLPDVAEARSWYERAKEYGSAEASQRIEMLIRRRQ